MDAASTAGHRAQVGRTLRRLRTARSLSLRELAALLEVSPATLSAVENGRTGVSTERLSRLAELLDVPVQHLLAPTTEDGTDTPGPAEAASPTGYAVSGLVEDDWRSFAPLELEPALAGALSSFLEFGYHGATMRTIAQRAGLSVPGLYHHHAGKQAMLAALLDLTMTDLMARAEAARDDGGEDPVRRFALLVECLALYHTHRRELAFVGASEMRSLAPSARERVAAARRAQQRMVDVEVERAVAAGSFATTRPHEAARAVVTMCTALAQWFRGTGPMTAEQVAAQYVGFALALVGATPAQAG